MKRELWPYVVDHGDSWANVQPYGTGVIIDSSCEPVLSPIEAERYAKAILRAAKEARKARKKS